MSLNYTSNYLVDYNCDTLSTYVVIAFDAVRAILLLIISTPILYLGHQQWRKQQSFKTASHSDIYAYHMSAMELIWVLGIICYYYGEYTHRSVMKTIGILISTIACCGELCFHVLTCLEHYLAVVHPITYLDLRNARGVRIRNIIIVCVWLLCFGLGLGFTDESMSKYTTISFVIFSIVIITFCSLSVLCVLIRPGPAVGGEEKERVDQSKLRAFHTITAITCAVWVLLFGLLVSTAVNVSPLLSKTVKCVVEMSLLWSNLPSCLVLPLLYLHRAGKLSCCCFKKN